MNPFPKMPKKRILVCSAMIILSLTVIGGTTAYLQSTVSKTNTVAVPIADITVSENASSFVFEQHSINKEVQIQNISYGDRSIPVYIRVRLVPIWRHSGSQTGTGIPVEGLAYKFGKDGTSDTPMDGWFWVGDKEQKEGWYYYKDPVPPNGITEYLIKSVTVSNDQPDCDLEIQVIADSIQSEGKDENDHTPAFDAWGVDPSKLS